MSQENASAPVSRSPRRLSVDAVEESAGELARRCFTRRTPVTDSFTPWLMPSRTPLTNSSAGAFGGLPEPLFR
jgi:hypothetical protein